MRSYSKSLHSYNPIPSGCVYYAPLWHPDLHGAAFKSIDSFEHECARTGGVMDGSGFNDDGDDFIDCGNISQLNFGDGASFAITGWFKTADLGTYRTIIAKGDGATPGTPQWLVRVDNTGKVYLEIADGTHYRQVSTNNVNFDDDTWHHFACVKNGDTEILIYVDGSAEATSGAGDALNLVDDMSNAIAVRIGSVIHATPYTFTGAIREVEVYDGTLSAGEISHIYNATKFC